MSICSSIRIYMKYYSSIINIQNTLYIEPHFLWTLGKKCIQLKILVAVLNCLYIYAYIE